MGVPATNAPEYSTDVTVIENLASQLVAAKFNHWSLPVILIL